MSITREELAEGVICPYCGQFAKEYKRKITSSMAYGLIKMYQFAKSNRIEQWIHVENMFKDTYSVPASIRGDFPKLRWWNLIEKRKGRKEDENPNRGFYRITQKGIAFVKREYCVQRFVHLFNNQLQRFSGPFVFINECLKDKFNYEILMKGG